LAEIFRVCACYIREGFKLPMKSVTPLGGQLLCFNPLIITVGLTRFYLQGSTLGVIIDPIKKSFKQKLFGIKFSTKKSVRAYLHLP